MSAEIPIKPLYTLKEAARLLGVTHDVMRRWVEAGHLECEWFNGRRYVSLASLKARPRLWDSITLCQLARANGSRRHE